MGMEVEMSEASGRSVLDDFFPRVAGSAAEIMQQAAAGVFNGLEAAAEAAAQGLRGKEFKIVNVDLSKLPAPTKKSIRRY